MTAAARCRMGIGRTHQVPRPFADNLIMEGSPDGNGRSLEEMIERREPHLSAFINYRLSGTVNERRDVFDSIARTFRCFGLQVIAVPDRVHELAEELVDAGFFRPLAKMIDERREVVKSLASGAADRPKHETTGATVNVPLFVQEGEWVKIDTAEGKYLERVNKR